MTHTPATILVVEDQEEINDLLQYNLGRAGYRPLAAYDGRAGLAAAREHRPDLVLLDVMLPGIDGWEICRALSADPALCHIPVIIFTAKGSREDFDHGHRFANVAGYFIKPYATSDVLLHVDRVLADRRR
ncbi:MAG: two component transcriptional regulator, winged helix family [Myxococcaceae bacterium]|nr:two component transcriptional regulator, winged helix family [Myxococcaceae bacterium]